MQPIRTPLAVDRAKLAPEVQAMEIVARNTRIALKVVVEVQAIDKCLTVDLRKLVAELLAIARLCPVDLAAASAETQPIASDLAVDRLWDNAELQAIERFFATDLANVAALVQPIASFLLMLFVKLTVEVHAIVTVWLLATPPPLGFNTHMRSNFMDTKSSTGL